MFLETTKLAKKMKDRLLKGKVKKSPMSEITEWQIIYIFFAPVSYTHLRAHET